MQLTKRKLKVENRRFLQQGLFQSSIFPDGSSVTENTRVPVT